MALALDELLGGLLSLGYALSNLPSHLLIDCLDAGPTPLAHVAGAVGELLRPPRRLDCSFLGLPSTLCGVVRAPRPDLDGVADRRGVDHGGRHLSPLVACASRSVLSRLQRPGQEPGGI